MADDELTNGNGSVPPANVDVEMKEEASVEVCMIIQDIALFSSLIA